MKTFSHKRIIRDKAGEVVSLKPSPATAVTDDEYVVLYTKPRKIIVSCEAGDVLVFREKGRRKKWLLAVDTAFRYAVRIEAAKARIDRINQRRP